MNKDTTDLSLNRIMWLEHLKTCATAYSKRKVEINAEPHPEMLEIFSGGREQAEKLLRKFQALPYQEFSEKHDPSYKAPSSPNSVSIYENNIKHKEIDQEAVVMLQEFFKGVQNKIEERLGYYVELVNVRFFEIVSNNEYEHPLHQDNFPSGIYKVLAYLNGASEENGSTEIILKNGEKKIIQVDGGGVCLFDSNNLTHRVLPPKKVSNTRISVEFTVAPSFFSQCDIKQPGLIATYPLVPEGSKNVAKAVEQSLEQKKSQFSIPSNSLPGLLIQTYEFRKNQLEKEPIGLNVGGGPFFLFPGWANIDGAFGVGNQEPFKFSANCNFPYEDSSIRYVYSSHVYEHLSDDVVFRITSEIRRVIREDGFCLIKFPIFDDMLRKYRANDFEQYRFITKDVEQYWKKKNIVVSDLNRCSFAFVNYWNNAYGKDHYEESSLKKEEGAFFGPTPAFVNQEEELAYLLKNGSPHEIAIRLRRSVIETDTDYIWGHQNAWSVNEFRELMKNHNFKVVETDTTKIYNACKSWPKVQKHYNESHWFLIQPC